MSRDAIGTMLLLLGGIVGRLVIDGQYLLFVKDSLAVPLLVSVAIVLGLSVATLFSGSGRDEDGVRAEADSATAPGHAGHHHVGHGPRMGLLLMAPMVVLLVVPAAPLGALAADNGATNSIESTSAFGPLPLADDGVAELLLTEVIGRALFEPETLGGADVRTEGFVVTMDERPGSYLLSRFTVGCCAVDAVPYQLVVDAGGAEVPAEEEWVRATLRATGDVLEDDGAQLPVFELLTHELIPVPEVPYIY